MDAVGTHIAASVTKPWMDAVGTHIAASVTKPWMDAVGTHVAASVMKPWLEVMGTQLAATVSPSFEAMGDRVAATMVNLFIEPLIPGLQPRARVTKPAGEADIPAVTSDFSPLWRKTWQEMNQAERLLAVICFWLIVRVLFFMAQVAADPAFTTNPTTALVDSGASMFDDLTAAALFTVFLQRRTR